ncbi:MAG TPA: DegT/DnrJ/EryC1/StrS family aminotransferase [Polyangiaceae bacterium]|nr:DegT/DnrJ/EryC1/StrS family aminotransferase [Polyangiaceae bacterium]
MLLCANPRAQYLAHKGAIDAAVLRVFDSGMYIKGEEMTSFEAEFASYVGVKHGVGVANGTDALRIALLACEVGAGDEVVTVSHTAVATISAIEQAGAVPVFVDVGSDDFVMDVAQVEQALTPRTKAVVAVHLYGQAVDLDPLLALCKKRGLRLIEDCAQAPGSLYHGQRLGTLGDAAAFSFYPTKNLGAIGDGGIIVTNDERVAQRANMQREYGWASRYISDVPGGNSRLDEVQAAILRVKLPYLDHDNEARRRVADFYRDALSGTDLELPAERPGNHHVYHLYVVRSPRRAAIIEEFKRRGIQAAIHYPMPVHAQPAYAARLRCAAPLTVTESVAKTILSLPMFPELTNAELEHVVGALRAAP